MAYGSDWALTDAKNMRADEFSKLLASAKKFGKKAHLMVVLAYNGALRVSELVHIKVTDFNWESGKLNMIPLKKAGLRRVKQADGTFKKVDKPLPKPIDYPLPSNVMEMARAYIKDEKIKSGFLFPGDVGAGGCIVVKLECQGGHMSKRGVQKIFDAVCVDAGIKVPGRGIHSLKHSRATEVAQKTKDPYLVKEICRHSTVAMSDNYVKYVELKAQIEKLGGTI
jgi:integrase